MPYIFHQKNAYLKTKGSFYWAMCEQTKKTWYRSYLGPIGRANRVAK